MAEDRVNAMRGYKASVLSSSSLLKANANKNMVKAPSTTQTPPNKQNNTPNPSSITSLAATSPARIFIMLNPGIRIRCVLPRGIKRALPCP